MSALFTCTYSFRILPTLFPFVHWGRNLVSWQVTNHFLLSSKLNSKTHTHTHFGNTQHTTVRYTASFSRGPLHSQKLGEKWISEEYAVKMAAAVTMNVINFESFRLIELVTVWMCHLQNYAFAMDQSHLWMSFTLLTVRPNSDVHFVRVTSPREGVPLTRDQFVIKSPFIVVCNNEWNQMSNFSPQ